MPVCTPGAIAPDFSLPDGEGRSRSLRVLCSNGPVLLTFFKISCPTCQSSLHFISRLHRNLAIAPGRRRGTQPFAPCFVLQRARLADLF